MRIDRRHADGVHLERHPVSPALAAAALDDFPARVAAEVEAAAGAARPAPAWRAVAESLLDHLAARSLTDPDLPGKDAEVALRSAAQAAAAGLGTGGPVRVDYTGTVAHVPPDPAAGGSFAAPVQAAHWLQAICLAYIADHDPPSPEVFVATRTPWRGSEARADVGLMHGLLAYLLGWVEDRDEAPTHGEVCAIVDRALFRLTAAQHERPEAVALLALRALAAGDEEGFGRELERLLERHRARRAPDPAPRTLLPLDAIALAAMAARIEGWKPRVESPYLPASFVYGYRGDGPRVGPYGRDRRPAAVAELALTPVEFARPVRADAAPGARPAPVPNPFAMTGDLIHAMHDHLAAFLLHAEGDPEARSAEGRELLWLAAEFGAAAFRLRRAAPGSEVEVTIGGCVRTLPADPRPAHPADWCAAAALALVFGERTMVADVVLTGAQTFEGVVPKTPGGPDGAGEVVAAYRDALHDYLRGADPEPATDRALRAWSSVSPDSVPRPPAVLLSQLVDGDEESFTLALLDALEEHRDHWAVGARARRVSSVNIDILGLVCHARRRGRTVPVRSPYLPQALVEAAEPI